MSFHDLKEQFTSSFRRVPIQWNGDQVAPVKVTTAGNMTLIGLDYRPILALQPVSVGTRESERPF